MLPRNLELIDADKVPRAIWNLALVTSVVA